MDLFLRAKHWQLFLAIIVLPIIVVVAIIICMLNNIVQLNQPDPAAIFSHLKFIPVAVVIYAVGKMCWQWAVAIRLQRLTPAGLPFKNSLFKIFFWYVILYYPLFFAFFFSFLGSFNFAGGMFDPSFIIWFVALIPLSFFNTFCMFYCYYFTAKTFKTVELQREVTFSDFILECVLTWFFFVGVWILQPKINSMIGQQGMLDEIASPPAI